MLNVLFCLASWPPAKRVCAINYPKETQWISRKLLAVASVVIAQEKTGTVS